MSVIFDYVPKSKAHKTCRHCGAAFRPTRSHPETKCCSRLCAAQYVAKHRKRKPCRLMTCLVCEKQFRPSWYGRKTCSRTCAHIRGSPRRQKIAPVRAPTAEMIDPNGSRLCTCGELLRFGYDFLGRSLELCPRCGERPVAIYGVRRYDQRQILEAELGAHVRTAKEPIPQAVSAFVGDAFRDVWHKKGAA